MLEQLSRHSLIDLTVRAGELHGLVDDFQKVEHSRRGPIDDVLALWRAESGAMADVISVRFAESQLGPAGLAFDIRLTGSDLNELKAAAMDLTTKLDSYRGTSNLTDDLRPGKPELRVRLRDGAATLGIDVRQIADQLRAAFFGTKVSEIQRGAEAYEIDVRIDPRNKDSLSDIDNFTISQSDGSLIPLTAVADIEIGRGFSRINRVNGQRTVTVQGDVDVEIANANEILNDTRKTFFPELAKRYPGVSVSLQGQNKEAQTTQRSMVSGFILGLIGVYLLLSFLFRNYVEPVIVMIIIPFALAGPLWVISCWDSISPCPVCSASSPWQGLWSMIPSCWSILSSTITGTRSPSPKRHRSPARRGSARSF